MTCNFIGNSDFGFTLPRTGRETFNNAKYIHQSKCERTHECIDQKMSKLISSSSGANSSLTATKNKKKGKLPTWSNRTALSPQVYFCQNGKLFSYIGLSLC